MAWPRGFDLRSLEILVSVAGTGSISAASDKLGISQSAISQHISLMEETLSKKLFDRSVRPMKLTTPGMALTKKATKIVELAEFALREASQFNSSRLAELRIAVINSLAVSLAPDFIRAIQKKLNPEKIELRAGFSLDHGQALIQREVDIILTTDPLEEMEGLERYTIIRDPFVLVLPKSFNENFSSLADLSKKLPFIRYSRNIYAGRQIELHLRRMSVSIPEFISLDSTRALSKLVGEGIGWSITTPICLLDGAYKTEHLKIEPFPGPGFSRSISLVARQDELGDLPRTLAQLCCRVFTSHCEPFINTSEVANLIEVTPPS